MAIRNDASLRGKIRSNYEERGLYQEVLQMFLFEHLLLRLEKRRMLICSFSKLYQADFFDD